MTTSTDKQPEVTGIKPMQSLSYAEKIKNDNEWGKQNIKYYVDAADFRIAEGSRLNGMQSWYNAYNNHIDAKQFEYVTNPLAAENPLYKNFPAKLRSYNILRPSIDLLIGEWSKRPFKYDVVNTDGDDLHNTFTNYQYKKFSDNIKQRFINEQAQYEQPGVAPDPNLPDPQTVIEDLNTNYKDLKAIKGYKALKVLEYEKKLKEQYKDQFKDFVIAGEVASLKFAHRDDIEYKRLSPMWVDVDKSPLEKNFEEGERGVVKFRVTVSDLIDMFYDELTKAHIKKLEETDSTFRSRLYFSLTNNDTNTSSTDKQRTNKVDLYYCCWKSRKKIGILSYLDEYTLERLEMVVDEDYPVDYENGEEIEWLWVNEVWEGWQYYTGGLPVFLGIKPVTAQRNELDNLSECKLPINGRRFSDTESANVSIMSLGMAYQIMYIIMMYRMELTIAKSKGKILVMDENIIPDSEEGGEDKFFYYGEALGYLLVDNNGDNIDRTVNTRYQVMDMSLYNDIAQLIKIAQFYKDSWEELLGINRQRKGELNATDGLGASEEAVFRSSIISDILFSTFDEWVESELQGLVDLTQYAWVDGKKGHYRSDDGRLELLSLEAGEAPNMSVGVFVDSTGRMAKKFEMLLAQVNAAAQRKDVKMSTVADMIFTDSYAELKAKLKEAEALEESIAQKIQQNEAAAEQAKDQRAKDFKEYEAILDMQFMQAQEDRLDNRVYITAEAAAATATTEIAPQQTIDIGAIEKESTRRLEVMTGHSLEREKIISAERIAKMKDITEKEKIKASLKNKVVGEK